MGAITFLVPCALIAVLSVPLMFDFVPPNRLYGLRTRQTLANRELWYRANHFTGYALFAASVASGAVFLLMPQYASGRSRAGLAIFVGPLLLAVAMSVAYARRVAPMTSDFSVDFETHLPGISLRYREAGRGEHEFDGELCSGKVVASIYAPSPAAWDAKLPWAAGRREEVLRRLAGEVIRRKAPGCRFAIHEGGVEIVAR